MKKVILLITLCILVMTTGCTTSEKIENKEIDVKSVYCNNCSEESKRSNKVLLKMWRRSKMVS